jgi:hydroxyacylglutathione hydrolase
VTTSSIPVRSAVALSVLVATLAAAAWVAPYLCTEYALHHDEPIVAPRAARPVAGQWFDDYFVVEAIDRATFAIGEPRYYQLNYSYLIVGTDRAVLFDAGTGSRDIVPVVRSLTKLPVTVVASHLHFDHVGALGRLDRTAALDVATLRTRAGDGTLQLRRYEFLGFGDGLAAPRFRVDEWWRPGATVDLGGRRLTVMHTPGHTATSVSLLDAEHHQLFCGDFVYPGELYAFVPGASRSAYRRTTEQLLAMLEPDTQLLTAHASEQGAVIRAPRLAVADLGALAVALEAIDDGTATATGFYPRVYPVNGNLTFATGFAWSTR